MRKKDKKNNSGNLNITELETDTGTFLSTKDRIINLISPNGINPNPLGYMVIEDAGQEIYTMCFTINELPKKLVFATSFAALLNYADCTKVINIKPLAAGKSTKMLDKRVVIIGSEVNAAEKANDRNRYRKMAAKMAEAEQWAENIESGSNALFEVRFLFVLQARSFEELRLKASDFHLLGKERGIELVSCYGVHPEAFLSGYPTNKIYDSLAGIPSNFIKKHHLDRGALCTIFNHTRTNFCHADGVPLGRNLSTGQPVLLNVYHESHKCYNLVATGLSGQGKSTSLKGLLSRYIDFGVKARIIDFEPRGTRGEYSVMTEMMSGANFSMTRDFASNEVINIFELSEELKYDEISGTETRTLDLAGKIENVVDLLMVMVRGGRDVDEFTNMVYMKDILTGIVSTLYSRRNISDGNPDSLYTEGTVVSKGKITTGRVKKALPTISDLYKEILIEQHKTRLVNNRLYEIPYQILAASLKCYVKELYYCPECLKFYTKDEFNVLSGEKDGLPICGCGAAVSTHRGIRPYYDGQSSVDADMDTPIINFDISQLSESERIVALLVSMNYMQENYIKKNSENPKKAGKMVVLVDELHKTFPFPEARHFVANCYRTARKRNVSMWSATQSLADFDFQGTDKETEGILKNSATKLIFRQAFQDRAFIKSATGITDSQVDRILTLGGEPDENGNISEDRRGEMCLIDDQKTVFVKFDYLKRSEARYVETDMQKLRKMYDNVG